MNSKNVNCSNDNCAGGVSRRRFVGFLISAAASISILRPLTAFSKEKWISIGMKDDFMNGGFTVVEKKKLFVFRDVDNFRTMSGKCTHFGCLVERQGDDTYHCPCHDAEFDRIGRVTKGPAKKDLVWHNTKVETTGEVMVDIKSVISPGVD